MTVCVRGSKIALLLMMVSLVVSGRDKWSVEQAVSWASAQEWTVGCNYVTSTAINQIEMWQAESFDPETMDVELGRAESLGFNVVRVFLSTHVYFDDPKGFKKRFSEFLSICDRHGIKALPTFWTNGGKCESPKLGKQPESVRGVHNSQWIMTPGAEYVNDSSRWPELERMVKDIIRTYRKDGRILMWCLYNEPENLRRGVRSSVPLMEETFRWARSCNPSQPLTAPLWHPVGSRNTSLPEVVCALDNSDVISFHCYDDKVTLENFIKSLLPFGRPMICTEYMRRPKSTFGDALPVFKKYGVGAISWGLTAGKCNFNFPWNKTDAEGKSIPWEYDEPEVWFHDIYRIDGTPYSTEEVDFIRSMTGQSSRKAR